jgi:hypothetical protein
MKPQNEPIHPELRRKTTNLTRAFTETLWPRIVPPNPPKKPGGIGNHPPETQQPCALRFRSYSLARDFSLLTRLNGRLDPTPNQFNRDGISCRAFTANASKTFEFSDLSKRKAMQQNVTGQSSPNPRWNIAHPLLPVPICREAQTPTLVSGQKVTHLTLSKTAMLPLLPEIFVGHGDVE